MRMRDGAKMLLVLFACLILTPALAQDRGKYSRDCFQALRGGMEPEPWFDDASPKELRARLKRDRSRYNSVLARPPPTPREDFLSRVAPC